MKFKKNIMKNLSLKIKSSLNNLVNTKISGRFNKFNITVIMAILIILTVFVISIFGISGLLKYDGENGSININDSSQISSKNTDIGDNDSASSKYFSSDEQLSMGLSSQSTISKIPTKIPTKVPTPTPLPFKLKWIDLKYSDVPVPTNLKNSSTEKIIQITGNVSKQILSDVSGIKDPIDLKLLLNYDNLNYDIEYADDAIYAKFKENSLLNNGTSIRENAATLYIISTKTDNPYFKLVKVDFDCQAERIKLVFKENTIKSKIIVSDYLKIISPRNPITSQQANDASTLTKFDPKEFSIVKNHGYKLKQICIGPLLDMFNAAKQSGISDLVMKDTYRTYDFQKNLFQARLLSRIYQGMSYTQAYKRTDYGTAYPGTSEHHGGYTLDVSDTEVEVSRSFENTAFGKWLSNHSYEYGFVIRYQKGKESITTKMYEPWHIRYVGVPTANLLKQYNITLEEFAKYLEKNKYFLYTYKYTDGIAKECYYFECNNIANISLPQKLPDNLSSIVTEFQKDQKIVFVTQ